MTDLLTLFLEDQIAEKKAAEKRAEVEAYLRENYAPQDLAKMAMAPIVADASQPPVEGGAPMGGAAPAPAAGAPMGGAPMGGAPAPAAAGGSPDPVALAQQTAAPALEARTNQLIQQGVEPNVAGLQAGAEASDATIQNASKAQVTSAKAMQQPGGMIPGMQQAQPTQPQGGAGAAAASGAPPAGGPAPTAGMPKLGSLAKLARSLTAHMPEEKKRKFVKKYEKIPSGVRIGVGTALGGAGGAMMGHSIDMARGGHKGKLLLAPAMAGANLGAGLLAKKMHSDAKKELEKDGSKVRVPARLLDSAAAGSAALGAGAGVAGTLGVQRAAREVRESKIQRAMEGSPFYKDNPKRSEEVATYLSKIPRKRPVGVTGRIRVLPVSDEQSEAIKQYKRQMGKTASAQPSSTFTKLAGVLGGFGRDPIPVAEKESEATMWCEQFAETPLFEQAKQLELEDAQLDIERAQFDSQNQENERARDDFWKRQDALRSRRNAMEAQLRMHKLQNAQAMINGTENGEEEEEEEEEENGAPEGPEQEMGTEAAEEGAEIEAEKVASWDAMVPDEVTNEYFQSQGPGLTEDQLTKLFFPRAASAQRAALDAHLEQQEKRASALDFLSRMSR